MEKTVDYIVVKVLARFEESNISFAALLRIRVSAVSDIDIFKVLVVPELEMFDSIDINSDYNTWKNFFKTYGIEEGNKEFQYLSKYLKKEFDVYKTPEYSKQIGKWASEIIVQNKEVGIYEDIRFRVGRVLGTHNFEFQLETENLSNANHPQEIKEEDNDMLEAVGGTGYEEEGNDLPNNAILLDVLPIVSPLFGQEIYHITKGTPLVVKLLKNPYNSGYFNILKVKKMELEEDKIIRPASVISIKKTAHNNYSIVVKFKDNLYAKFSESEIIKLKTITTEKYLRFYVEDDIDNKKLIVNKEYLESNMRYFMGIIIFISVITGIAFFLDIL